MNVPKNGAKTFMVESEHFSRRDFSSHSLHVYGIIIVSRNRQAKIELRFSSSKFISSCTCMGQSISVHGI